MMISSLRVGPPTRRELALGRAHLIFDRRAPRAPAPLLSRHILYHVYSENLSLRLSKHIFNPVACAPSISLPPGAPQAVSTELDSDSQRLCFSADALVACPGYGWRNHRQAGLSVQVSTIDSTCLAANISGRPLAFLMLQLPMHTQNLAQSYPCTDVRGCEMFFCYFIAKRIVDLAIKSLAVCN
jgi:hypothetical protein